MRRRKLLTTGDVTYQYGGGVGPSPKGVTVAGDVSVPSKSPTGTARLITAEQGRLRHINDGANAP